VAEPAERSEPAAQHLADEQAREEPTAEPEAAEVAPVPRNSDEPLPVLHPRPRDRHLARRRLEPLVYPNRVSLAGGDEAQRAAGPRAGGELLLGRLAAGFEIRTLLLPPTVAAPAEEQRRRPPDDEEERPRASAATAASGAIAAVACVTHARREVEQHCVDAVA